MLGFLALLPLVRAQTPRKPKRPAPSAPVAQPAQASPLPADLPVKRLILKDGSYQGIDKYQVLGDRVRYLSSERYEWEDVPASLVDWAATEKYAREGGHQASAGTRQVDAEEAAERKKEEELTPLVAPGLRLPATGGVILLDVYNKQAQALELTQNGGEIKRNMKGNILRSTINPLASQKQTIELSGQHAALQAHVPNPYIYVNIDQDQDNSAGPKPLALKDRFRIVRVVSDAKKNIRIVGNIKIAIYGKVTQEQKFIPTNVDTFSGPWLKVTPAEPLEPGEYALVEMLEDNQMNLFVWDFGVNPNAPENPGAWRPEPMKASAADADKAPVLQPKQP